MVESTLPSFGAHRSSRSSRSSSTSSNRPNLSLDLSNLPPLSQPTPPSNTLLITNLHDLLLFQPPALDTIRAQLNAVARLNSFSPLPSLRRIICSFHSVDDAVTIRKMLDGQALLNDRAHVRTKIYFGENTPILNESEARHPKNFLQAPQVDKLFFISPPPSPPHGWVMRPEDPPNKEVHAGDLAVALAQLSTEQEGGAAPAGGGVVEDPAAMEGVVGTGSGGIGPDTPMSLTSDNRAGSWPLSFSSHPRSRSSTLIYHPDNHGSSPDLPAVMVEDTTTVAIEEPSPIDMSVKKTPPKTTRPPVELME